MKSLIFLDYKVEICKFELLGTRDFNLKYQKFEPCNIIQLLTYVEVDMECY